MQKFPSIPKYNLRIPDTNTNEGFTVSPIHKVLMSCLKDYIKLSKRLIHPVVKRFNL